MTRTLPILALIAGLAPGAAGAWQAGSEGRICTLAHAEDGTEILLTYDPSVPLYTITLTGPDPWPVSGLFGIRFDGDAPNTITTDRHVLSDDGRSLTVSDRGFGNVLNGLAGNRTATGFSGAASVTVSLEGAAAEVVAFEACGAAPSA
jgi:hypothetical protein